MFQGETEEVKLSIEKSCCCVKRARKRSWSDRTRQVETVHITSGSRLQARLEETAADVVYFQEHRWSAPRLPEQRSRIRKNGWDLTQSPPLQSERSESAASGGAVMNRTVLFLNTMTQVLLAIDLPLKVDGVFNLAGRGASAVRLASRSTRAYCGAEQRHADVPGLHRQRQGHRFLCGIGGAAPLLELWQLTKDPQSYALTGRLF